MVKAEEKDENECSLEVCDCKICRPGECDEDNECVCECANEEKDENEKQGN